MEPNILRARSWHFPVLKTVVVHRFYRKLIYVLAVKSNATGSETVLFADFTNFRTFTIQHEIIPVISKSVKRTKASIMRFFFDIKAKRTPSIVRKLFSKRSEHIR